MELSNQAYQQLADRLAPKSNTALNCIKAFAVGGGICVLGQALKNLYLSLGTGENPAALLTSVSLVFLSALLTGLGLYDDIAKQAGAGTLVPITGFANSDVHDCRTGDRLRHPGQRRLRAAVLADPVLSARLRAFFS